MSKEKKEVCAVCGTDYHTMIIIQFHEKNICFCKACFKGIKSAVEDWAGSKF